MDGIEQIMIDHQEGDSQNKHSSNQGSVNNRRPQNLNVNINNNLGTGKKTLQGAHQESYINLEQKGNSSRRQFTGQNTEEKRPGQE